MDEPVRCGLRTARSNGLTSPEPVTAHPHRRNGSPTQPPDQDPDKPQKVSGNSATPWPLAVSVFHPDSA